MRRLPSGRAGRLESENPLRDVHAAMIPEYPTEDSPDLRNRLLRALPAEELERLEGLLEPVELRMRETLVEADRPARYVVFPDGGVTSVLVRAGDDEVEVATVGYEGVIGLPLVLGGDESNEHVIAQVPGPARRAERVAFVRTLDELPTLRSVLARYVYAYSAQVAQTAVCNRLHSVDQRCARWLLGTHDRVGADEFPITHEFLSLMLGVRRAGVTEAAGELQRAGVVRYARGRITVLDRVGLEAAACVCNTAVRERYERLLGSNVLDAARGAASQN